MVQIPANYRPSKATRARGLPMLTSTDIGRRLSNNNRLTDWRREKSTTLTANKLSTWKSL